MTDKVNSYLQLTASPRPRLSNFRAMTDKVNSYLQPRFIRMIALMVVFGLLGAITCSSLFRIGGARIPESQVISSSADLCIGFAGSAGSAENVCMFTYRCSNPSKPENCQSPAVIATTWTMECPVIRLKDKDRDGFREVYVTQDRLCKEFAHPWQPDERILNFVISPEGSFVNTN